MTNLVFDIPPIEKNKMGLEDQIHFINDHIIHLNNSVSLLEEELKKNSEDKMHDIVIFLGCYQELNKYFHILCGYCTDLKNRFPNLSDDVINHDYSINLRLKEMHATLNALFYPSEI